jgi:hypothetical protein
MKFLILVGAILLLGSASLYIWGFESNPSSFFTSFILAPIGLADLGLLALAVASFVLTRSSLSRVHGRSIAVTFLAIGVLFAFVGAASTTDAVGCLGPCGDNGGLPLIEASITVNPGTHNGTLTVQFQAISNDNRSFTTIALTNESEDNITTLSNAAGLKFIYSGSPVSAANPLTSDQTATGSIEVTGVTVGTDYTIEVTGISQGDIHTVQEITITAQV